MQLVCTNWPKMVLITEDIQTKHN